jgi:GTPase SAR1 family protein
MSVRTSPDEALLISFQVPVILVGNKIDLRGGEVTNEALEDEIVPIMNEYKVSVVVASPDTMTNYSVGGRDLCGVLSEDASECLRSILFCPKGCSPSYCSLV